MNRIFNILFNKKAVLSLCLLAALFSCTLPGSMNSKVLQSSLSLTIPRYAPWMGDAGKSRALGFTDRVFLIVKNNKEEVIFKEYYEAAGGNPDSIFLNVPLPAGDNYRVEIALFNHQVSQKEPTLRGVSEPFSIKNGASVPLTLYCIPANEELLAPGSTLNFDIMTTAMDNNGNLSLQGGEKWIRFKSPSLDKLELFVPELSVPSGVSAYFRLFDSKGRPEGSTFQSIPEGFSSLKPERDYYMGVLPGVPELKKKSSWVFPFWKEQRPLRLLLLRRIKIRPCLL